MLNEATLIDLQREIIDRWNWGDGNLARHGGVCKILRGSLSGVYFLAAEFFDGTALIPVVKIGCSKNIPQRIWDQIRSDIPMRMWVIYQHVSVEPRSEERAYHKQFEQYRLKKNREWFLLEPIAKFLNLPWEKMIHE